MPVYLDRPLSCEAHAGSRARRRDIPKNCVRIGLINNMPDGALRATERQFLNLLESAASSFPVRLSFFYLPGVPRSDWGRNHVRTFYSGIEDLWDSPLDGLIVTGAEPRFPSLAHEPYWGELTEVLKWADENTSSSIWSCLAAHAAVFHMDGLERHRLDDKRFGLFRCVPASVHPLISGNSSGVMIPHSRWNDLREQELLACGYQILGRSCEAGVDVFVKEKRSLFVFFQGHPEYEANTLLLEYRRDIGRYLRGERENYPAMPQCYFDSETEAALRALEDRFSSDRREERLAEFPSDALERNLKNRWHSAASRVYRNWLACLSGKKQPSMGKRAAGRSTLRAPVPNRLSAAGAD